MTSTYATGSYSYSTYSSIDSEIENEDVFLVHDIQSSQECTLEPRIEYSKAKQRGTWAHKIDFIMSATGYVIGYGNVWRFPYLAYAHGGGTFLIPYFFMLAFVGFPLFFMEITLAQYSGLGPTFIFPRMAPIVSGLGYGMCTCMFLGDVAYILVLSWSIYYLFAGLVTDLPWTFCSTNRPFCIDSRNLTENVTDLHCYPECVWATEDFYQHTVLGKTQWKNSWCDYGDINWTMLFCHLFSWTLVGSAAIQGIRSSTRVVYFTVPFPLVVLLILGCLCLTLDGVGDGISYYVTPEYSKLGEPSVWVNAATQIFYSLSIGFGTLHTLSSFNRFDNNCFHDALIISLSDTLVSITAGFVIFGMIGFISKATGQDIENVVRGGPNLAFITLPHAVSQMPFPRFWSFISFSMLVTLGLDTLFADFENIITSILDHNNWLRPYRTWVVVTVSFVGFLSGLSLIAPQGYEMFNIFDANSNYWNLILMVLVEIVTVSWVYGAYNLWENVEEMGMEINDYVKHYLLLCWLVVSPMILCFLLFWHSYCQISPERCNSAPSKELPGIHLLGHLLSVTPLVYLPLFAIKEALKLQQMGSIADMALLFHPTQKWGPCKDKSRPRKKTNLDSTTYRTWPPINNVPPHWDPVEVLRTSLDVANTRVPSFKQGTLNSLTENTGVPSTQTTVVN